MKGLTEFGGGDHCVGFGPPCNAKEDSDKSTEINAAYIIRSIMMYDVCFYSVE
jgi:hypothetical protein